MIKLPTLKFSEIYTNKKVLIPVVLLVVLLVIGIFVFTKYKRNSIHDLPTILESGRLAVLTDSSRMGFSTKGDSVYGFQYEIIKAFADTLGLELVITEESDLANCMKDLKGGDYDIIASVIPQTTEWEKEALFTETLFTARQMLVQRKDSTHTKLVKSHFELANDTIFLPMNSPNKMRIEHLSDEIASPIHIIEVSKKSTEQMVQMVSRGLIKYTICDELFAQRLKLQYPNIDVSFPVGFEQNQVWAVHRDSPKLLAELNSFLNDFIGSSDYWKIYRKYYN